MQSFRTRFAAIDPTLIPCASGKILAVSHPRDPLRVGIVGNDETQARENFAVEVLAWAAILDEPSNESKM